MALTENVTFLTAVPLEEKPKKDANLIRLLEHTQVLVTELLNLAEGLKEAIEKKCATSRPSAEPTLGTSECICIPKPVEVKVATSQPPGEPTPACICTPKPIEAKFATSRPSAEPTLDTLACTCTPKPTEAKIATSPPSAEPALATSGCSCTPICICRPKGTAKKIAEDVQPREETKPEEVDESECKKKSDMCTGCCYRCFTKLGPGKESSKVEFQPEEEIKQDAEAKDQPSEEAKTEAQPEVGSEDAPEGVKEEEKS